jgi:hypothetical protein
MVKEITTANTIDSAIMPYLPSRRSGFHGLLVQPVVRSDA